MAMDAFTRFLSCTILKNCMGWEHTIGKRQITQQHSTVQGIHIKRSKEGTCVLWIDGMEVGTWLCICKGGSSIGILLKIRCKTKCYKTRLYQQERCTCETWKTWLLALMNFKDSIFANNQSPLNTLQYTSKTFNSMHNINKHVWRPVENPWLFH